MGLDMYLTKKTFIGANYEHRCITGNIDIFVRGEHVPIQFNRVSEIVEQVGYWRKANAIHQWFVENVQNGEDECQESEVSKEQLAELLDIVKRVKADHSLASELLPTQNGFFFGSTEYDNWYFEDLDQTEEILTPLVEEEDAFYPAYFYQASW